MNDDQGDDGANFGAGVTGPTWTLELRSARALDEVRAAVEVLGPQTGAWKQALRDVHSHIWGERTSVLDDALNTNLLDAYRRLHDEMLRLSTMLDPDIFLYDPEDPA